MKFLYLNRTIDRPEDVAILRAEARLQGWDASDQDFSDALEMWDNDVSPYSPGEYAPIKWPSLNDDITEGAATSPFEYGTAMFDVSGTVRRMREWFVEKPKKARGK